MTAPVVPAATGSSQKRITRASFLGFLNSSKIKLCYDAFAKKPYISLQGSEWSEVCDIVLRRLWADSEIVLEFLPPKSVLFELAKDEAHRHTFDPLLDYLENLTWDGTPRVNSFLAKYFGATDSPLNAEFSARFLIGAARRAIRPGTKHDTMLVLEGPEGALKSSAIRALCHDEKWFLDSFELDQGDKKLIEQTGGKWLVEVQELAGMPKAGVDDLKATLSRQSDKARAAFGHFAEEVKRRFVLFGTVNPGSTGYLKSTTGNRRFWICAVGDIDLDKIKRDRDQLWAEAMHRHRAGEQNWLLPEFVADAEAVADDRREELPWVEALRNELKDVMNTTVHKAFNLLSVPVAQQNRKSQMQMADALKDLGFKKGNKQAGKPRMWTRG